MPFKGGIKEAAKMLSGLDPEAQQRILIEIAVNNPEMAEALRDGMVVMEDLQYLTEKMMQELLLDIDLADLGLALRICSIELREHILGNVSKNMRQEINDVLNGKPQAVTKVHEATARIMEVVKDKVTKGQLVLKDDGGELV